MRIVFQNMERSELAEKIARERLGEVAAKYPDLHPQRWLVTLAMENSPVQPGPDLFRVRLVARERAFGEIVMEKRSGQLYQALSQLREALTERLQRASRRRAARWRRPFRQDWGKAG